MGVLQPTPPQAKCNCPASLSEALAPKLRPHLGASCGGEMESLGGLGDSRVVDQVLSLGVSTQRFHSLLCPRPLPPEGWGRSGHWEWGGAGGEEGCWAARRGSCSAASPCLFPAFQNHLSAFSLCPPPTFPILDSSSGVLGYGGWQ